MMIPAADATRIMLLREAAAAGAVSPAEMQSRPAGEDTDVELLLAHLRSRIDHDHDFARLARQLPWLTGVRPGAWLLLPALLAGALFSGLTAGGRFNILAPPLLGLLMWQILVYLLLLVPRRSDSAVATGGRLLLAIGQRLVRTGTRLAGVPGRFLVAFAEQAPALLVARLAATLHAAAAAFALGAIVGLYFDGLGVAYQAYWESTFLGAGLVTAVVHLVLGPASWLTGIHLPDAASVAAMASTPVPAAPWIHLWAATIAWVAIAPRLLLAAAALLRTRRHRHVALDLSDPVLRRILADLRGTGLTVAILPLGYRPDSHTLERLRGALDGVFHGHIHAEVLEPVAVDAAALPETAPGLERLVLLLNPAQTPEAEVHGPLLTRAAGQAPIHVVLDAMAYRTTPDRRTTRIDAWRRLLDERHIDHFVLETES